MRRWPFQSSEQAPLEHFPVIEDLLRRNVEDIFRVERQEVRGVTFGWGGTLLVEPARALALRESGLQPFGNDPFLDPGGVAGWLRAFALALARAPGGERGGRRMVYLARRSRPRAGCLAKRA